MDRENTNERRLLFSIRAAEKAAMSRSHGYSGLFLCMSLQRYTHRRQFDLNWTHIEIFHTVIH